MVNLPTELKHIKAWLGTGSINIFGRPFAGKDTQAERLAALLDGISLGGGHILRNSPIPEDIQEIMNTGSLIPSDAYVKIVLPYLSSEDLRERPLILSSVGRMDGEQHGVVAALNASGHNLKAVVLLDIDEDTVRHRWDILHSINLRGRERDDDSIELLNTRLEWFRKQTIPVLDYYQDQGILIKIDGHLSEDDVTGLILDKFDKLALNRAST